MAATYTLVSWATIIGLVVLGYYYYKPGQARQSVSKVTAKLTEKSKEPKKLRKVRKDDGLTTKEKDQKEQPKQKAEYTIVADDVDPDEEEINNKEFAKQFSNAQAGTVMPAKSQAGARQKSIKQTRAQEKPPVVETSSDNGTTGADADDDRSSLNSPELGATSVASPIANGVSDMLEAPAPGPSVLRVTAPATPSVPKKAKAAPTHEVAETKKQRQNRKKAEAQKKAREEDEEERKKLLEKQRRTAREAEGRPAKDGSKFMAAQAPSSSAWTTPASNGGKAPEAMKADLLDTYTPKAPTPQETTQSASESDWQKVAVNMSEEEQMRLALEDSDSWKTVAKDKRSKKKTQQPAMPTKLESNDESSDYAPPPLIPPTPAGQKWKMTVVSQDADGEYHERETEVQDSEWEVA